MSFPGGRFTLDPGSNIPLPANTTATGAYTYDRAFSRWLPVPRDWVSPDGARFAYGDQDGAIHVVDVPSGADRKLVDAGSVGDATRRWTVLDVENGAIYLSAVPRTGGFSSGLWVAAIGDGTVRRIVDHGNWQAVDATTAWGSPDMVEGAAGEATLLRLDLKAGAATDWFHHGQAQLVVLGPQGSGALVMVATQSSTEVWAVDGPGSAAKVYSGPGPQATDALRAIGTGVKDDHGLWLGSPEGLLLYSQGAGFRRMSSAAGWVGGPCY